MIPHNLLPLANHLWQSTVFAAAIMLLAFALRRNRAETRFRLWFAASVKFLIPFSLLVSAGGHWELPRTSVAAARLPAGVEQIGQAFVISPQVFGPPIDTRSPSFPIVTALFMMIWAVGSALILFRWLRNWIDLHRIAVRATPLPMDTAIPVRSSPHLMEPGVFGLFRPILLLPEGIGARLKPEQLAAIVAHELSHVRRRDNLTAAIHMAVECLFWFHPLVWWIGARLTEEREHACDEEVLVLGNRPEVYAEGILNVCRSAWNRRCHALPVLQARI